MNRQFSEDDLMGTFAVVPKQVLEHNLLTKLMTYDLAKLAQVNSLFKKLTESDLVWKKLFIDDFEVESIELPRLSFREARWKNRYHEYGMQILDWNHEDLRKNGNRVYPSDTTILETSGGWNVQRVGKRALPTHGIVKIEFEIINGLGSNFMFGLLGSSSSLITNPSGYPGHGNMGFSSGTNNCCLYIDNKSEGSKIQMWIDLTNKVVTFGWEGNVSYRKENNPPKHQISLKDLTTPLYPCISVMGNHKIALRKPKHTLYESIENLF